MSDHQQAIRDQFSPQAQAYLHSSVHAQGPDLVRAGERVQASLPASASALDLGCGGGHLSFLLARCVHSVVAADPSAEMLAVVAATAAAQGLDGLRTLQCRAEQLPLADQSLDLVATRYSAHHWEDVEAALREMRRVLRPGGVAMVIDVLAQPLALVDAHLQTMELLRDRSHVRNRSVADWQRLLPAAGFGEIECEAWPLRLDFASWVARMRTPEDRIATIRSLQQQAPDEVQRAMHFEADGSFTVETGLFWCRAV